METVPGFTTVTSYNRYIPSGLSTLSSWPLTSSGTAHGARPRSALLDVVPAAPASPLPDGRAQDRGPVNGLAGVQRPRQNGRRSNEYVDSPARYQSPPPAAVEQTRNISTAQLRSTGGQRSSRSKTSVSVCGLLSPGTFQNDSSCSSSWSSLANDGTSVSVIECGDSATAAASSLHCSSATYRQQELKPEIHPHKPSIASHVTSHDSIKMAATPNTIKNNDIHLPFPTCSMTSVEQNSITSAQPQKTSLSGKRSAEKSTLTVDGHLVGETDVGGQVEESCASTITCQQCGQCKCSQCSRRRELPSGWCGRFECSARKAVDVVSCLCCVRAFFYHCRGGGCMNADVDDDPECGVDLSDRPCSCSDRETGSTSCCRRWACLVLASVSCLPCLLLYWPLRLFVALTARCYGACWDARGRGRGCRCRGAVRECQKERTGKRVKTKSGVCSETSLSGHGLLVDNESWTGESIVSRGKFDLPVA